MDKVIDFIKKHPQVIALAIGVAIVFGILLIHGVDVHTPFNQ